MRTDEATPTGRRRLGAGALVVLVLVAFAVTVAVGMLRGSSSSADLVDAPLPPSAAGRPSPPGVAVPGPSSAAYVHVAGAVVNPGLYALPTGARAVDAVAAAGGFTGDADRSAVNLAREVADDEQLLVPVVGAAPPPTTGAGAAPEAGGVTDLNAADAAALDALPGIGPALAQRILDWRAENGSFGTVDDLLAVPGIGEKVLEGLRDRVRV